MLIPRILYFYYVKITFAPQRNIPIILYYYRMAAAAL